MPSTHTVAITILPFANTPLGLLLVLFLFYFTCHFKIRSTINVSVLLLMHPLQQNTHWHSVFVFHVKVVDVLRIFANTRSLFWLTSLFLALSFELLLRYQIQTAPLSTPVAERNAKEADSRRQSLFHASFTLHITSQHFTFSLQI